MSMPVLSMNTLFRTVPATHVPATNETRHVSSQVLLEGSRELVIHHQGNSYRLRLTRNDKLILTK